MQGRPSTGDMAEYPRFKRLLLDYVSRLKNLNRTEPRASKQWRAIFAKNSVEELADAVEAITVPELKEILEKEEEPTIKDFCRLPAINGDWHFGVYHGLLESIKPSLKYNYAYIGSATSRQGGLTYRVDFQHMSPAYRRRMKNKKRSLRLYHLMDDKKNPKLVTFRKLCVSSLEGPQRPERVTFERAICKLAEQVYSGWLRTFDERSVASHPSYTQMSPWKTNVLLPTNYTPPIFEPFYDDDDGADDKNCPIQDPEEARLRHLEQKKLTRKNWSPEERYANNARKNALFKQVTEPQKGMRARNVPEDVIKEFDRVGRAKVDAQYPLWSRKREQFLEPDHDSPENLDLDRTGTISTPAQKPLKRKRPGRNLVVVERRPSSKVPTATSVAKQTCVQGQAPASAPDESISCNPLEGFDPENASIALGLDPSLGSPADRQTLGQARTQAQIPVIEIADSSDDEPDRGPKREKVAADHKPLNPSLNFSAGRQVPGQARTQVPVPVIELDDSTDSEPEEIGSFKKAKTIDEHTHGLQTTAETPTTGQPHAQVSTPVIELDSKGKLQGGCGPKKPKTRPVRKPQARKRDPRQHDLTGWVKLAKKSGSK